MPLRKPDRPSTSQLCLLIDQFIDALSVHYGKNYALLNFALNSSQANSENRCKWRVQEEKQLINTLPYWRNNVSSVLASHLSLIHLNIEIL